MGATASKTTTSAPVPTIEYALKNHDHNALYALKGDYALKNEVYTKPVADEKYATFQPKGDYALKNEVYNKTTIDEKYATFQKDYALKTELTNLKGPQGIQGIPGQKGDTGLTGPAGIQGNRGETGLTGPQGIQGIPGQKGDTGLAGIQGQIGLAGIQGIQGLPGKDGEVTNQFLKENSLWCADGDICTVPKNIVSSKDITISGKSVFQGLLTSKGGAIFETGSTFDGFSNLNGPSTHGGLATFNGNTRFNKNISVHPDNVFSIDEVNVPGGRLKIDATGARLGGDLTIAKNATANQFNAKKITIGAWNIEETPRGLQFNKNGSGSYIIKSMDGDRWVDWTTTGI
jgi:Collagen triple helix repeat (20 copies)